MRARGLLPRAQRRVRALGARAGLARQAAVLPAGLGAAARVEPALEAAREVDELAETRAREHLARAHRADTGGAADDQSCAGRESLRDHRDEVRVRRRAARGIAD